jgi:hypothetical protein
MRTSTSLWHNRNEIPLPPPPAGFFLPSRPHTSPPAGISGHAPTPPSRQAFLLPACLAAPPFAACPSPGGRCPPHCPDCTRQTFLHRLARTPHPSEGIPRNPCARTPRQAFPPPPAGFFLPSRPHTHTPPHSSPRYTPIAHPPHKPRSTPPAPHPAVAAPSTAVFFLWRLFRLCRTGMIYSQKTFYF